MHVWLKGHGHGKRPLGKNRGQDNRRRHDGLLEAVRALCATRNTHTVEGRNIHGRGLQQPFSALPRPSSPQVQVLQQVPGYAPLLCRDAHGQVEWIVNYLILTMPPHNKACLYDADSLATPYNMQHEKNILGVTGRSYVITYPISIHGPRSNLS